MIQEKKLSRRAFLAGTAALGATVALTGCATQTLEESAPAGQAGVEAGTVEVRHAWCQMCGPCKNPCSTLCYIKDGRWVNVEGNPDAFNNGTHGTRTLCAKGNSAMQVIYDPTRILYPMKRVGEKGEGKFERTTWDEAINAIAATLLEQKEKYGPESYGVLSPQAFKVLGTVGRRFLNVHGSPNYMHSAICAIQRAKSKQVSIGSASTDPSQLDKTKLLVVWGANAENSAINQGKPIARVKAMQNGLKVVDIRPMMDALTAKADIWMPIRPGTDCALALAFLNIIIGEDLYDHEFVENWCNGFDKLAEHVKQYTPEWAAEVTGLPVEQIYEVGRLMGNTKPMGIQYGNGIGDQQNDGNWACVAMCLIVAITGNLDIPGGGGGAGASYPALFKLNGFDRLSDRLQASEEDIEKGYYAGMAKLVGPELPRWFQNPKTWESGPNTAYYKGIMSILSEEPYPLRAILGQCSNPFGATRQPKKVAEALKKLELYVVMDTHWNSSCDYADYVLPACSQYECSQMIEVKNGKEGTFVGMQQKIADPLGESISDWDFYMKLAVAMGYGADFWDGDYDKCLREFLDGTGVTLEQLREANRGIFFERPADFVPSEPKYKKYAKLFEQLPGGKVQCYNEWIGGKPNSCETGTLAYMPEYAGPPESHYNTPELVEEYPLIITDVHAYRLCNHSYFVSLPYLRELQPYPWCKINPATAQKYGIADGDWMKIESPHGWIKLKAKYFEGLSPEVLMCRRGWWQSCEELGLPGYGSLDGGSDSTVLYDSTIENFDPFHSAMAKQTLVKISKIEEGAE